MAAALFEGNQFTALSMNINKYITIILTVIICLLLWINHMSSNNTGYAKKSVVNDSINSSYDAPLENLGVKYHYEQGKHIIQPDNSPINLKQFNKLKFDITVNQVMNIMKAKPIKQDDESMRWQNGEAYIYVEFQFGKLLQKTRNFDGEHESPDRWNNFWKTPHKVNDEYAFLSLSNRVWEKPFVSADGQSGQGPIDDDTGYLYTKSKRLVQPDNALVSLPNFDKVTIGMTEQQVVSVLGKPHLDRGSEKWWFDSSYGRAMIIIEFKNGNVSCKIRNFDGEHESPDRWNNFWSQHHDVNKLYNCEGQVIPS